MSMVNSIKVITQIIDLIPFIRWVRPLNQCHWWYLAFPGCISNQSNLCNSPEKHLMHIWHRLPLMTNTCHQLTEHKWARTRPLRARSLQTNRAHMFHMLHCSVAWCITWNYDNSVIFMIPILESGTDRANCGVLAAPVTIIEVPLVLLHTDTRAHVHTHIHKGAPLV